MAPASSTLAMLGWSIMARACRSASKRAMTCLVSIPSLMIFRATLRVTGSLLLGHVDHAEAAFADLLEELVAADDRAGALDSSLGCSVAYDGRIQQATLPLVRLKQSFHLGS